MKSTNSLLRLPGIPKQFSLPLAIHGNAAKPRPGRHAALCKCVSGQEGVPSAGPPVFEEHELLNSSLVVQPEEGSGKGPYCELEFDAVLQKELKENGWCIIGCTSLSFNSHSLLLPTGTDTFQICSPDRFQITIFVHENELSLERVPKLSNSFICVS